MLYWCLVSLASRNKASASSGDKIDVSSFSKLLLLSFNSLLFPSDTRILLLQASNRSAVGILFNTSLILLFFIDLLASAYVFRVLSLGTIQEKVKMNLAS